MKNPNDVFWLARYAHNKLAPLFEQAKLVEPSILYSIDLTFADKDAHYFRENSVKVQSWWGRDGMFQNSPSLKDKAAVDLFIAKVSTDIENLQPLVLNPFNVPLAV